MPSTKPTARREGQILILMALLSTTLIILFGMVVSVGHLVQAKINLQNAVDLAAMSGASWQARYLNHIALVNYRMRQNYKMTLYDLYVTQSRFNLGFRQDVGGQYNPGMNPFSRVSKSRWVFGICQQMEGYMPQAAIGESGEGTASGTDMCQNVDDSRNYIPPIVASPVISTNPVILAANEAIKRLSERAQSVCRGASGQNATYFKYIMEHLESRQLFQMTQLQTVLTDFADAFRPYEGEDLGGGGGKAAQAVLRTFRSNLISANAAANIRFVNPSRTLAVTGDFGALFDQMFKTRVPPPPQFSDYFDVLESFFRINVVNINVDSAGGCQFSVAQKVFPVGGKGGLGTFLGLARSRSSQDPSRPKIPFGVVLRAEVQPRLLFWPRGLTPTLVAVSAAKPFGSRIGPPKEQSDYEVSGGQSVRTGGGDNVYPLANMAFYPGDVDTGDGTYPGVGHKKILGFLYNALMNPTKGNNRDRPSILNTSNNCQGGDSSFVCLALSPTLYESLFWSIFPYPPASAGEILKNVFPSDVFVKAADDRYNMLDRMSAAGGSYNDLWHYTSDDLGRNSTFQGAGGKPLFFADRNTVLSSWSPTDTAFRQGRLGYQIKLSSVNEICSDIQSGGTVGLGEALTGYCGGGSGYNKVAH